MNIIRKPFKYSFFYATFILLAVNAVVFFATMTVPYLFYGLNLRNYLGISFYRIVRYHFFWTPVTYLFVHDGWMHFIFNMLALVMFGIQLERAMGSKEFLLFYFICGVLDGILSVVIYALFGWEILIIGASGAIYAILLAYAVVFPRSIISIWGIIPVPAPLLVAIYAVIELLSGLFARNNVANLTHLCGLGLAWIYFLVRMGINPVRVWKSAWRR